MFSVLPCHQLLCFIPFQLLPALSLCVFRSLTLACTETLLSAFANGLILRRCHQTDCGKFFIHCFPLVYQFLSIYFTGYQPGTLAAHVALWPISPKLCLRGQVPFCLMSKSDTCALAFDEWVSWRINECVLHILSRMEIPETAWVVGGASDPLPTKAFPQAPMNWQTPRRS